MSQQAKKVQLAHSQSRTSSDIQNNYFMILSQMVHIPKVVAFLNKYFLSNLNY